MELSVIIVNWNTREYLYRCLKSINACPLTQGKCEIIVVDNASSDESAGIVQEHYPDTVLIRNTSNEGFAEGNNQGMRMARGDFLLLLNPDTEVKRGTLDRLLEFAREHPDAGAAACRLIEPGGKVQRSCRSFPKPLGVFFEYTGLSKLFPKSKVIGAYRMTYFNYEHECEIDQPMASCMLIPRKAFEDVGEFDPVFPIFFNEVDWCYRAKQKGWKIYFTPDAEILHHGGASTVQVRPDMIMESHKSLRRFYEKHYRRCIPTPIYWLIVTAIGINSFIASRLAYLGKTGNR